MKVFVIKKIFFWGAFLVVQWLRLFALIPGDPSSISGQVTKSHMLQLKDLACLNENLVQSNKYIEISILFLNLFLTTKAKAVKAKIKKLDYQFS